MSFVVATASPPFTPAGTIQVYAYEPFSYRFLFSPGNTFGNFSNTSTNLLGYLSVDATGVSFVGSNGFNSIVSSNGNPLVIVDSAKNVYSNLVFGGAGRFKDGSDNPLPTRIVVYANEAFAPIPFVPSVYVNPSTAFTQPSLPAAMTFLGFSSNLFVLGGQPAATTGASNYVFVASNALGQVISANINIQILPERLQLTVVPTDVSLTVGVPVTPVRFKAIKPIASTNLIFSYPSLPSGLYFTDSSGVNISNYIYPNSPSDGILDLSGTPTVETPSLGTQTIAVTLGARVTSVFSGVLSNSVSLNFRYTETVVFTTPSNNVVFSNTFAGLPITPIVFNAASYFGTTYVDRVFSPDLRSDLSLNSTTGLAALTGTPTFAGSGTYTATAVSGSGVSGSIKFSVVSQNDVVTLSPFVDSSLNFIIGRPLDSPLAGYYSSNITLTATSLAGRPLTFTTTGFVDGGITVTSNGSNIAFSGVPTALVGSTTAVVTVSDGVDTAVQTVPFAVSDDTFTWASLTPTFLQNQVITPLQISATTLSGRVLISYVASGLPSGLSMSRSGLITGTCFSSPPAFPPSTFVITGSTGISTQSHIYSYTIIPDTLLLSAAAPSYSLTPGQVVPPINLYPLLSSGSAASNFALVGSTYGLTITPTGVLSGSLYSGLLPNVLLPTANIAVSVSVGTSIVPSTITLISSALYYLGQFQAGNNQIRGVYSAIGGTPGYNVLVTGSPFAGDTQVSVDPVLFMPYLGVTASDIQVNSSGKYVASLSGLDSRGTTAIGSVVYGSVNQPILNRTFLTSSGLYTRYRSTYSIAYSGSGSTWYALGLGQNIRRGFVTRSTHVYLLASADDGQTWTPGYTTTTGTGNWAIAVGPEYTDANPNRVWGYADFFCATQNIDGLPLGGVVLRYSQSADVYMAGGGNGPIISDPTYYPPFSSSAVYLGYSAIRINRMVTPITVAEEAATIVPSWTPVTTLFAKETRDFAIDVPSGTPWIAAGSSLYYLMTYRPVSRLPASTLRWSIDNGSTWSTSTNDFTLSAVSVTYGGGRWVAVGTDIGSVAFYAKTSTDGQTWTNITSIPASLLMSSKAVYANGTWSIRATSPNSFVNLTSDLSASWIYVAGTSPFAVSAVSGGFNTLYPYSSNSVLSISTIDTSIQLVSPANTAYSIMQYTFMTPITLAINRSPAYFFITNDGIPNGIKFDAKSATFSGMPLTAGSYVVRVAAKSTAAVYNYFEFTFRVYSPYPQKRQDTASAFTSYLRQEAIIGGAQFSRDSNAFPSENTTVGAAMGPFPPEVNTPPIPCCKLPS